MSAMVVNARMYSVTPAAMAAWKTLFDWVLARAGVEGNWVPHDPPLLIADLWERDDLACVMMCGLPFSRRTPKPTLLAAPIPSAPRYGGRSVYATDLAVRADATFTKLEDTFGGIAGFTVPDSQSGYYAFRHHLLTKHADQPAPYRAHVGRLLNARGIIQALADRRIDVGPLDGYVFDLIRASDPAFAAQVKVIVTTPPARPCSLIASSCPHRAISTCNARAPHTSMRPANIGNDRNMRTRIRGGWVVGHSRGAHTLDREHEVVFEGDEILFVGPKFDGRVDREIDAAGKLVSPGFIDTYVHSGHRASHRLITDTGRGDFFGQPFLEISVPKEGTRIEGDARYLRPDETGAEGEREFHALFTVAELLRNGITTFVEYGSQRLIQDALMEQCLKLGVRGYLGPGYDSGRWVGDEHGRLKRITDEENGRREFAAALEWIEGNDGTGKGLIKGILVPREVETTSLELLRMTREKADEMKLPMATHAAYSIIEFYEVVREHRRTPIELLDELGMLRPTMNIGHGNIPSDSVRLNYPGARDLALMGAAKVSISHCAINIVRRARVLDNWKRYCELGINIALGTDTYPRDMILNMRTASYHGKTMSHDYKSATAADVFSAATLNGARSLGRDDLGRLAPGARADIILIDLTGGGTLRMGPVRDPVISVVECGVGDDVDTVIVAGEIRMQGGVIPGVDLNAIRQRAQSSSEQIWAGWHKSDPLGRTHEQTTPWSFCPACYRDGPDA